MHDARALFKIRHGLIVFLTIDEKNRSVEIEIFLVENVFFIVVCTLLIVFVIVTTTLVKLV
jgi:hypothetical protein